MSKDFDLIETSKCQISFLNDYLLALRQGINFPKKSKLRKHKNFEIFEKVLSDKCFIGLNIF